MSDTINNLVDQANEILKASELFGGIKKASDFEDRDDFIEAKGAEEFAHNPKQSIGFGGGYHLGCCYLYSPKTGNPIANAIFKIDNHGSNFDRKLLVKIEYLTSFDNNPYIEGLRPRNIVSKDVTSSVKKVKDIVSAFEDAKEKQLLANDAKDNEQAARNVRLKEMITDFDNASEIKLAPLGTHSQKWIGRNKTETMKTENGIEIELDGDELTYSLTLAKLVITTDSPIKAAKVVKTITELAQD
ncbi:hypothetical protein VCHA53O466_140008 [Vibrio chagasii]|nr:hypothetical protein VCHA53O466_140008 [Vibrio chagasii]